MDGSVDALPVGVDVAGGGSGRNAVTQPESVSTMTRALATAAPTRRLRLRCAVVTGKEPGAIVNVFTLLGAVWLLGAIWVLSGFWAGAQGRRNDTSIASSANRGATFASMRCLAIVIASSVARVLRKAAGGLVELVTELAVDDGVRSPQLQHDHVAEERGEVDEDPVDAVAQAPLRATLLVVLERLDLPRRAGGIA